MVGDSSQIIAVRQTIVDDFQIAHDALARGMTVSDQSPMLRHAATVLFWLAFVFAVTMALLPHPPHLPIDRFGDKFEHMLAFATLTVLARFAFPAMPALRIAERLSFLGALIEVTQSIPALHRDCDIRDWIADTLAILVVTGLIAWWRHSRKAVPIDRAFD
jgi:VanZ family protein